MHRDSARHTTGFTLAELLIVVALVVILVAIAIPVFAGATEDAEEAVCAANRRSVKAAYATAYLLNPSQDRQALFDRCLEEVKSQNNGILCPEGGVYTATFAREDTINVICSVHGVSQDDEMYQWVAITFDGSKWNDYFSYKDDQTIRSQYAQDRGLSSWPPLKGTDAQGNQKTYYLEFKSYNNTASGVFLYAGYRSDPTERDWLARYICDTTGLLGEDSVGQWYEVPENSGVAMYGDSQKYKLVALLQEGTPVNLVNGTFEKAS